MSGVRSGSPYAGMTLNQAAAAMGKTPQQAVHKLSTMGYRREADGTYRPAPSAYEVQDAIADRIAAAPPSAPCFRCGSARGCVCRDRRAA